MSAMLQGSSRVLRLCLWMMGALTIAGCQTSQVFENQPAPGQQAAGGSPLGVGGYRAASLPQNGTSPELLVMAAFSGGGKRSAAFSYGVMRGLRDTAITVEGRGRRLLDELDAIGSVSGGTFTAAYYGLHREKLFTDYEADFLRRDIEAYIYGIYLLPWHWEWLFNPYYGTNDAMEVVYDRLMFKGATYADFAARGVPQINIGATDISYGAVFAFNQENFDLLCSELGTFPIARAVAASNGFPVLFSPITLTNHADKCGGWRPSWIDRVRRADGSDPLSRQAQLARLAENYLDSRKTAYVHLMDGGISDNLAMRGVVNAITLFGEDDRVLRAANLHRIRRILILGVDGQAAQDVTKAQQRIVTGIGGILSAVSGAQIDQYNFETMVLARSEMHDLVRSLKRLRCAQAPVIDGHACDDVEGYFVHLSLATVSDPETRRKLESIPTGLTIPDDGIDQLIAAGEAAVRSAGDLARFRDSLNRPR